MFLVGLITLAIFSFKSQSESITRNVAIPLAAISKEMILLSKSGYQRSKTTTRLHTESYLLIHSYLLTLTYLLLLTYSLTHWLTHSLTLTYSLTHSFISSIGNEDEHHVRYKLYEISKIQESFEDLKSGLEAFSKYVPREVVSKVLTTNQFSQLGMCLLTHSLTHSLTHLLTLTHSLTHSFTHSLTGVHPKNVTIFFSDIAGYTSICEKLKPNEVLLMLSEYFTEMSIIINSMGGVLLEFIGTYLLTHSLTHSLTLTHLLTHSYSLTLTHSLTYSLTYLLTYLCFP